MYSREVNGQTLTFGVSGKLWHNALVMYDRETESEWSHITGEAIAGKLKGKRLMMLAGMPRITWGTWKKLYPHTQLLAPVSPIDNMPGDRYAAYQQDPRRIGLFRPKKLDARVPPKELVLGVVIGTDSKAYRHSTLRKQPLVVDKVGSTPLLVYFDVKEGATAVYVQPNEGAYRLEGDTIVGETGKWQAATGRSLSGGADLKALPHTNAYWFGWSAYYPKTEVYR